MTKDMQRKWLLPFMVAVAAVLGLTGVLMLLHLKNGPIENVHQWMGLIFMIALGFHLVFHRRAITAIWRQENLTVVLVTVIILALLFLAGGVYRENGPGPGAGRHGAPAGQQP